MTSYGRKIRKLIENSRVVEVPAPLPHFFINWRVVADILPFLGGTINATVGKNVGGKSTYTPATTTYLCERHILVRSGLTSIFGSAPKSCRLFVPPPFQYMLYDTGKGLLIFAGFDLEASQDTIQTGDCRCSWSAFYPGSRLNSSCMQANWDITGPPGAWDACGSNMLQYSTCPNRDTLILDITI